MASATKSWLSALMFSGWIEKTELVLQNLDTFNKNMWTGNEDSSESLGCSDLNIGSQTQDIFFSEGHSLSGCPQLTPSVPLSSPTTCINLFRRTLFEEQQTFGLTPVHSINGTSKCWSKNTCRCGLVVESVSHAGLRLNQISTSELTLNTCTTPKTKQNTRTFSGNSMLALANPHVNTQYYV